MKTVKVVAAIIHRDGKIFATARGYGDFKGGWEFPGGKALRREILEELDTEIRVEEMIDTIEYDYPTFHLSMECFWCSVVRGDLILNEAEAARWLTREELWSVAWLPADETIIEEVGERMRSAAPDENR